ncbi:hypothetical protein M3223_05765 [Paenibacillus pasadenensis]|uniref:hypothetical protein n=1 Tax=Paenibacillus pasadenensis TaxID=217090 RepID=UPI00203D52DF|nr:hypothetical protein [Paenibacillus pasadenensis]MCM3746859.1 hypothetical protein [Paenibacillus pasadenensis]
MINEFTHISSYSNVGIILVLFILLAIVTSIFCYIPDEKGERDVSIQSTYDFGLYNASTLYRLRFYTRTGQINFPELNLYPGEKEVLKLRFNGFEQQVGTITYRVYYNADKSTPPSMLGEISYQLEGTPALGLIKLLRNTSPARTLSNGLKSEYILD